MSLGRAIGWGLGSALLFVGAPNLPHSVAVAQNVVAPHNESGVIGSLAPGQTATGQLAGLGDAPEASYHTYTVNVPPGTQQLVVRMSAAGDLDLGIKHGSPIETYGPGADWDLGDVSYENSATLTVDNPPAGVWYIDVINSLRTTNPISYRLDVQ